MLIEYPPPTSTFKAYGPESVAYLLDATGEIQLKVEAENATQIFEIELQAKFPATGYASMAFHADTMLLKPTAITEMCHFSAALAYCFATVLEARGSIKGGRKVINNKIQLPGRNLELAANLILGEADYNKKQIMTYFQTIGSQDSLADSQPPPSVRHEIETHWGSFSVEEAAIESH